MNTDFTLQIQEAQRRQRERIRQAEEEERRQAEESRMAAIDQFRLKLLSYLGDDLLGLGRLDYHQTFGPGLLFPFNGLRFGLFFEQSLRFQYWLVVRLEDSYSQLLRIEVFINSSKDTLRDAVLCAIAELADLGEDIALRESGKSVRSQRKAMEERNEA